MLTMAAVLLGSCGCSLKLHHPTSPAAALRRYLLSEPKRQTLVTERLRSEDADLRRQGVYLLSARPYTSMQTSAALLDGVARTDSDNLVRLSAVKMLRYYPEYPELLGVLADTAEDVDPKVRMETLLTLKHLRGCEGIVTILVKRLQQDTEDPVRARAAHELQFYPVTESLESLLQSIGDENFQVSYRSRLSLQRLTGQDFVYDQQAWKLWYTENLDNPFVPLVGDL